MDFLRSSILLSVVQKLTFAYSLPIRQASSATWSESQPPISLGRIFQLSVCLSVCPQHNSKTNDTKVFKLGVGNDLGIP